MSALTRIGLLGLHHPNPVVSELEMGARQGVLGHVAGHTGGLLAGSAGHARMIWSRFGRMGGSMAAQAPVVIICCVAHQCFVRIVASDAGESRITCSPAAAALKTIDRKAEGKNAGYAAEAGVH